ncbi:hypothetical protein [Microlunatus flavus]|uniref:Uncharacterized protein n=1 Tax=Microlunatus flavus TaxID=1036181 RepID=A0A1H9IJF6_9ACTN|nr:hypothetical protein [Microlunatus flavus]SEQ74723.1 hypothetical protein SAMN05421756_105276 [Microlunatus flavus]
MTTSAEEPEGDLRTRLVAAFFGGIRSGADQFEHFRWTREYAEWSIELCDRAERLGLPAAYLVVELCCFGHEPLRLEEAVATVEAICQPPELPVPRG